MQIKKKLSVKNANGVKQFYYENFVNSNHRPAMEDNYFVIDRYLDNCAKSILFGVFDGHGTDKVSKYLAEYYPSFLKKEYAGGKNNMGDSLKNSFLMIDNKIRTEIQESEQGGSTGTVGVILLQESQRVLYIAHVGDSSVYLFDDKGGEKLTPDHRGDNPEQRKRISQCGGSLIMNRVGGVLAVTRAFGDFHLKKIGLTVVPAVRKVELRLNHRYLIVGTDGLWDYITGEEVMDIIKSEVEIEDITKALIKRAVKNSSTDNVSVIVLKL